MQKLSNLLKGVNPIAVYGSQSQSINAIAFDSRSVNSNTLFVAQKGTHVDGHAFIETAIEKGASVIVCETLPEKLLEIKTYIHVQESSEALGIMASNFYENPSQSLKLIGITGTNGKTTTVTLLYKMFSNLGFKVGLISTIINKIHNKEIPATHTTPDAIQLNQLLSEMVNEGCEYCFMEVSSHAIVQKRIAGIRFFGGIFSNITHDHLDFHETFENYIKAKKAFFDTLPKTAFALTNKDDRNGEVMLQNTKAKKYTYSLQSIADFRCKIIENSFQGLHLNFNGKETWTRLAGKFNAYNLLAVYSTALLCGINENEALEKLSNLQAAEGRFEYIEGAYKIGIVDYAHTPDALTNVLQTINAVRQGNERLITVVGCGGNRDATKRPVMAKIAAEMSNQLILTSDNPRNEDPEHILNEMEAGLDPVLKRKTLRITNRREAIKTACILAQVGDIILVAGKGHEKYQEINGVRHHFDDKEELKNNLS